MIAASEPLEFVPHGRQQVAKHPGPPENQKNNDLDDCLQTGFKKLGFLESKPDEFWIIRKAPDDDMSQNRDNKSLKTCNTDARSNIISSSKEPPVEYSDMLEESLNFKTPETSLHKKIVGKRLSDASIRFPNKRFSCGLSEKKSETKSGDLNRTQNAPLATNPKLSLQVEPGFMEDELYVKGETAVWSRGLLNNIDQQDNGRHVISCYTVPLPIKQVLWVTLYCERPTFEPVLADLYTKINEPSGTPIPAICIVDSHHVRLFIIKGEQFVIAMPFHIEKVWNTKFGILIERSFENTTEDKSLQDNSGSLFSLTYPLDDVNVVAISRGSSITRFSSVNYRVVYTNEDPSICMLFDTQTKEHSVYKIRKVRCDEKDYGEHQSDAHSAAFSSAKKSRQSFFEDLMRSDHIVTPSPIHTNKATERLLHPHKSRSLNSMATISRCQSPASSQMDSPWPGQSSKKDYMCRSVVQDKDNTTYNSYFNYEKSMTHLIPNPSICLEYLWTDTYSVQDTITGSPATKVFLTEDMVGQWYLCYVLPSRFQLSVVKVDFSGSNMAFGVLTCISAKDAVNISHLRMMAILEHSGNVTLYCGLSMVGKLHIGGTLLQHTPSPYVRRQMPSCFPKRSSLLPLAKPSEPIFDEHLLSPVSPAPHSNLLASNWNPTPLRYRFQDSIRPEKESTLIGLIDSIENRFTLKYSDGTFYRIMLPIFTHSSLIEHCLVALRQCLPKDATLILACRWYSARNVLGTEDVDARQEWEMFSNLLLELLGYEDDHLFEKPETPAVKRQRHSLSASDEDWTNLNKSLGVRYQQSLASLLQLPFTCEKSSSYLAKPSTLKVSINPKGALFVYIRYVHFTLHLLYEDFKLNTLYTECLLPLAQLLSRFSNDLGLKDYTLHYWKDFPNEIAINEARIEENLLKNVVAWQGSDDTAVSVMEQIYKLLKGEVVSPYPYFANVNNRSRDIVQLCGILSDANRHSPTELLLDSFIRDVSQDPLQNFHQKSFGHTSVEHTAVLLMVDMKIDTKYMETLPTSINYLLYNALWKCREDPPSDWPVEAHHLLWRDDLVAQARKVQMDKDKLFQEKMNICFQLQETMPNTKQEIADLDGMEDVDCTLTKARFSDDVRIVEARKMLASSKPVFITLTQRPDVSDHDFIEEQEKHLYGICIRTMALPVGRGMFTLRTATPIITEPLPAPSLCLTGKAPPRGNTVELCHIDTPANMNMWPLFHNGVANGLRITPDAQNIDSTWIVFNKPKGSELEMEHAGFLMALGLNGHLKNLMVTSTFDYIRKAHEMTSIGILLGLSAAFRETCQNYLTMMLAIHIEALLPPTSMELDVSHNLQVAGLLGVGLLYQRSAHRHVTEVLLSEIGRPPGPEMDNSIDRESYSLAAGLALGLVMLKHGDQPSGMSDINVPVMLHYYMVGGNKRPLTGAQKDKYKTPSFQIREGSSVNLDVTAPGATLALGMMYLGTGNKAVADWMAPPETQYLLDFVRPDFLMLRVLSRSLILWDDIEPSKEWVIGEVPAKIRPYCMVIPTNNADIDYEAMNQAYCNIVTGACFALGLKFAGSADKDAFETLLYFCHMFTSLTGKSIAELAGKATIETCLNVLLISASMVMAGTGNLEIMRLVRHLRRRVGVPNSAIVTYGSHLAIHMALGLLFLGGGRYTLSNTPANVAALICAFYPKFPTHSNDNRYHLQAFRHLYVLAVEPRLIIPRDVLSDEICYTNLRVVKLGGQELSIRVPGLIPDINTLNKVIVDDERYWPVVFERGRNWDLLTRILSTTGCIEVKQRAGCLSYTADKFGFLSNLAHTLTHSKVVPWDPPYGSIVHFTSDESVIKFCETVLNIDKSTSSHVEQKIVQLLTRTTYDAVVKDKLMIISIMISLLKVILNLESNASSMGIWQLKIILHQNHSKSSSDNLLSKETILALQQEVVELLERREESLKLNLQKYLIGGDFENDADAAGILAAYIIFFNIPTNLPLDTVKMNVFERALSLQNVINGRINPEVMARVLKICQ